MQRVRESLENHHSNARCPDVSVLQPSGQGGFDPICNGYRITRSENRNILKAAGTDLNNVAEVQVLLARPDDFAGLNEEYAKFFKTDPPIRSVARLGPETPGVLVSIKMIAVVP